MKFNKLSEELDRNYNEYEEVSETEDDSKENK